ncbi:MAG: AAA family ATPase [Clostridiales bacterium]|nr:AAA family ATPase [Clostridiales bacterium]
MNYTQDHIDRANQTDLVAFLQARGEPLERAGAEYRWKRHDSLTVRENKWYRHSRSRGGGPVDFVMEFYAKSFTEAVAMLLNETPPILTPDTPEFRLPPRSPDNSTVRKYLTEVRRIDEDVTDFFIFNGDLYESAEHHNAVFVGRDSEGIPRYAHSKGTIGSFRADAKGRDKSIPFCYQGEGDRLFVFEAPVDLLSFLCLYKKDWQKQSYLSLGGVGEKALLHFLSDRSNIKTVFLCLDSDGAGNAACTRINNLIPDKYAVNRLEPVCKDWNEILQHRSEITDGKYLSQPVYSLREQLVEIIRMSEVDEQAVDWLWKPYIPFGKVTIIQGNPGEGKTTLALRLCAACTNRKSFPDMAELEPFNVIYQTAEDGLGDTVKPRLMEAEADLARVLVIDEAKKELSLSDERIEKAIRQNSAQLIVLDPLQAYLGAEADMNRANEIRPIIKRLADVAERTGCAVILLGHLNKASGTQAAYRGLGSIDFRAAARSVLLIGRVKREPNIRVIIHDKSSLAPEGESMAFSLGDKEGFRWIGRYDITADELLSGKGGDTESKEDLATKLILDLLADGKEIFSEEIEKAAAEIGISERTVRNAKKKLGDRLKSRRVGTQWVCSLSQTANETANDIDSCRLPDGFCQMEMTPDYSDQKQRLAKAAEIMGLRFVDITDQCSQEKQKE